MTLTDRLNLDAEQQQIARTARYLGFIKQVCVPTASFKERIRFGCRVGNQLAHWRWQ